MERFHITVRVFLWAGIKITKFSIFTKCEYANKRELWLSAPLIEIPCYMLCFWFSMLFLLQSSVGKFILFLVLAKRGKGNALFVFLLAYALGEKQNVHFPLWWTFSFVFETTLKECKTTLQSLNSAMLQYKITSKKLNPAMQ